MDEGKIFAAFGLEQPTGENGQGVADPANANGAAASTGAQGQEVADPAAGGANGQNTDPETPEGNPGADGGAAGEMTKEQRSANAARRRQQEQQAAVDAAVRAEQEKHRAQLEDIFAKAGLKNTITGAPIKTLEDFQGWYGEFSSAKFQQDLKNGKLTEEGLARIIAEHPAMKQAQQLISAQEQAQKTQQEAADRARIDAELVAIGKLDPQVKTVQDLLNLPEGQQIRELVNKGYSFEHAHLIATQARREETRNTAARQAAQQAARGKEHLKGTGNVRSDGAVEVPQDTMRYFQALNPNATKADIQAFYNKMIKGG